VDAAGALQAQVLPGGDAARQVAGHPHRVGGDGALNDAQVREQAAVLLRTYDRRMRTLKVSSLGVPGLRAGQMLYMQVPGLGDINLDQWVMLEKVSHTWENGVHTMEFETYPL